MDIQDLAGVIIGTRDFCGDEMRAAREWFQDQGAKFDSAVYLRAMDIANAEWRDSQRAAGVPPKYWR